MEYQAIAKNIKITPRKMRLVVDEVKRNDVKKVLALLSVVNKRAGRPLKKVIESAISNAVNNFKANKDNLTIKDIMVTEGASYKRYHFAARGRIRPYKKRTSHIRVILSDNKSEALSRKSETNIKKENINIEEKLGKEEK